MSGAASGQLSRFVIDGNTLEGDCVIAADRRAAKV